MKMYKTLIVFLSMTMFQQTVSWVETYDMSVAKKNYLQSIIHDLSEEKERVLAAKFILADLSQERGMLGNCNESIALYDSIMHDDRVDYKFRVWAKWLYVQSILKSSQSSFFEDSATKKANRYKIIETLKSIVVDAHADEIIKENSVLLLAGMLLDGTRKERLYAQELINKLPLESRAMGLYLLSNPFETIVLSDAHIQQHSNIHVLEFYKQGLKSGDKVSESVMQLHVIQFYFRGNASVVSYEQGMALCQSIIEDARVLNVFKMYATLFMAEALCNNGLLEGRKKAIILSKTAYAEIKNSTGDDMSRKHKKQLMQRFKHILQEHA